MNITRGKREDKTETEAMALRIYDRLRKREQRHPRLFEGGYLDGVRDALEAVAEEVGE